MSSQLLQNPVLCVRDPATGIKSPGMGRRIALDIARGLHFLHSKKIVHFDLKSANVLLSRDFTAKIADVGLAKIMQQQFLSTLYCVGTFAWAAPEVSFPLQPCYNLSHTMYPARFHILQPAGEESSWLLSMRLPCMATAVIQLCINCKRILV